MASIHLYVPQQTLTYSAFIDVRPRRVQQWLEELPQANLGQTAQAVRTALLEMNKVQMPVAQRMVVLRMMVPVVEQLGRGLYNSYRTSAFPPSDELLSNINVLHQIYASMANGFKILVSAVQRSGKSMDGDNELFMEAMRGAMDYLSLQLLQAYEVYFPEPKRVWGELHYLYLLAHRQGLLDVTPSLKSGGGLSLAARYKRSVMLTLVNPYHLMQGECRQLYDKLGAWAGQCTLTSWRSGHCPGGRFFVDMGTDSPPRYAPAKMQLTPIYPFLIELGDVIGILKRLIRDLRVGESTRQDDTRVNFSDRRLRSTYDRVALAWGGRTERLSARVHGMSDTVMLMGLSTSWRLFGEISPDLELDPDSVEEAGEQALERKRESGLRLMDIEEHIAQASASVDAQEQASGSFAGSAGAGAEQAEEVQTVDLGAVDSAEIFKGGAGDAPIMEEDTSRWRQRNQSQGGVSLFCFMDCAAQVRVGEVIAFRPSASRWNEDWKLGAVRWLRVQPGQGLELGVRTMSDDTGAVRARALVGVGAGGKPTRSLLMPRRDPRVYPTTLMTPPAIYDEGTVLALELSPGEVIPVRLETVVDSSDRYTQFRFTCLEQPPKVKAWNEME